MGGIEKGWNSSMLFIWGVLVKYLGSRWRSTEGKGQFFLAPNKPAPLRDVDPLPHSGGLLVEHGVVHPGVSGGHGPLQDDALRGKGRGGNATEGGESFENY